MEPSGLTEDDVCGVFRVVLDCLDHGFEPVAWRKRLLVGLAGLVDADLCLADMMPTDPSHNGTKVPLMVTHAADAAGERRQTRFLREIDIVNDPITPIIMREWHRPLTARVGEMIDPGEWAASPYVRRTYHAADIHDWIHSRVPLPAAGLVSVLGFTRRKGQPTFAERERRIVELAHTELAARVAVPKGHRPNAIDELPTRLQELATHLRGPKSEKEIAVAMLLSKHTVHNYVRSLYKRLGVASRTELIHALKARDGRSADRHEVLLN